MSEASSKITWRNCIPKVIAWLIGGGQPAPLFMVTLDADNAKLLRDKVANDDTC